MPPDRASRPLPCAPAASRPDAIERQIDAAIPRCARTPRSVAGTSEVSRPPCMSPNEIEALRPEATSRDWHESLVARDSATRAPAPGFVLGGSIAPARSAVNASDRRRDE